MKYDWVDNHRRQELIERVKRGEKIVAVARDLDINYGNAKCIITSQKREKMRRMNGELRQRRRPRLQKMFVV